MSSVREDEQRNVRRESGNQNGGLKDKKWISYALLPMYAALLAAMH